MSSIRFVIARSALFSFFVGVLSGERNDILAGCEGVGERQMEDDDG
jgi:hypothetical protein